MSDKPPELSPGGFATWRNEIREYRDYLEKRYPERYELQRLRQEIRDVIDQQLRNIPGCDAVVLRLEVLLKTGGQT